MVAFLAQASINGRAYLAPAVPPQSSVPSTTPGQVFAFLAPRLAGARALFAAATVQPDTPAVISATVRLKIIPPNWGMKTVHFSN